MEKKDEHIKKKLEEVMKRIDYLRFPFIELDEHKELELRNLEIIQMQLWSELKDF